MPAWSVALPGRSALRASSWNVCERSRSRSALLGRCRTTPPIPPGRPPGFALPHWSEPRRSDASEAEEACWPDPLPCPVHRCLHRPFSFPRMVFANPGLGLDPRHREPRRREPHHGCPRSAAGRKSCRLGMDTAAIPSRLVCSSARTYHMANSPACSSGSGQSCLSGSRAGSSARRRGTAKREPASPARIVSTMECGIVNGSLS